MFKKISIILPVLCLIIFIAGCSKTEYIIDENNLTYKIGSKLYLNIQAIGAIKKGQKIFILKVTEPVYIKPLEELILKKGWQLKGWSGNELMIKEKSDITSAIKIKNADSIQIKDFHLQMDEYAPALGKSLIEIDNEKKWDGKIEISNMKLSNHYSALWVKRGRNIILDSCLIFDNGHQINLGFLPTDKSKINKYKVDNVTIKNSVIRDSKKFGNINGIKMLSNCTGIKILNNLIASNHQDGIDLYPGGVDVEIKDNTIRDNGVHGIEVKMYIDYLPSQTGQIKNVQIIGNNIINNAHDGIACLDTIMNYYAKGISILNNRIDSSGIYGIRSELPVRIESNRLFRNGLRKNSKNPSRPVGYTGIYLLGGRPNDSSFVINNKIIDQAPLMRLNSIYWLTVTQAESFTTIKENKFVISPNSINSTVPKFGIGLVDSISYFDIPVVRTQNAFSNKFTENVRCNSNLCRYIESKLLIKKHDKVMHYKVVHYKPACNNMQNGNRLDSSPSAFAPTLAVIRKEQELQIKPCPKK